MNWSASFSILCYPGVLSYIAKGIVFTLVLSVLAVVVSILLGSVLALCRNYCQGRSRIFRWIATVYIEIFRNTPLLLWIFICLVACPCPRFFARKMWGLTSVEMKILFRAVVALVLFESSIIAEIIRGGLMAVDPGQMEAGRSLGLNYMTTMVVIIIPQAIRAVLPALGNEFIVLLKDTSLITVIGGKELLYAAQGIMNRTYEAMFPLFGVALIYLVLVMIFTWLLAKFERRLAQSDR